LEISKIRGVAAGLLATGVVLLSTNVAGSSFNAEAIGTLTLIDAIADDSEAFDSSDLTFDFVPNDEQFFYEEGNVVAIAKSSPTLTFSGGFLNPTILVDVTAESSGEASASGDLATAESEASSLFDLFVENDSVSTGYTISG